ncbi:MAG TPA: trypsin-like peptidase domain-containing protein, partial [Thermoanaerobaculia bacterium]|nr:trypsin-like peptidase domain-containing protein [Thermoanaerobaculia bacterium]
MRSFPAAPRLAERIAIAPAAVLAAADASQIEEIHVWNREGHTPAKNGFLRKFPELVSVRVSGAPSAKSAPLAGGIIATSEGGVVWSGSFRIEGADRTRLHLENVTLPAGAVLWVYGDGQTPIAFDSSLVDPNGSLWTPSVRGGNVHLEIEIASPKSENDAAAFNVNEVMQLVAPKVVAKPEDSPTCLIDVTCVTNATLNGVNDLRQGIAHLEFVKGSSSYVCSGGLLNDQVQGTLVPYLLTANHCLNTQASASSLEAFWDWRFANCESNTIPNVENFPRSNGATQLASSANSDFSFMRLNSVPSNRLFLGWNANTSVVGNGAKLHRISHPAPEDIGMLPQMYSNTTVTTTVGTCTGASRPQFIYSSQGEGGVYGGSSGAPALIDNGQVVGQLLGSCGPDPEAGCDARNSTIDGAFAQTYPSIRTFLEGTSTSTCVASATTVCLSSDRFSVSVVWKTADSNGAGQAIKYTADSALFWFFSESNIEMLVKVLNGCGLNSRYWFFSAATTNVEYTITVTDTKSGSVKTYFHALGTPAPAVTDTG